MASGKPGAVQPAAGNAAVPAHDPNWEAAKAAFQAAEKRADAAGRAHSAMENEQHAFEKTAPSRNLTYHKGKFRVLPAGFEDPEQTFGHGLAVTHRNYNLEHTTSVLEKTPEYDDFIAQMTVWEARRQSLADARGWAAIEREWDESLDASVDAWRRLVACPVRTTAQVVEKLHIARSTHYGDADAELLLDSISADLGRLTGGA